MLPHQRPAPIDTAAAQATEPSTSRGRKRARDSSPSGTARAQRNREQSKKKKANRACFHCQKAHLTCDDSAYDSYPVSGAVIDWDGAGRPCQRCLKRGMGDSCVEGIRKKAKYLLDEEELGACDGALARCALSLAQQK